MPDAADQQSSPPAGGPSPSRQATSFVVKIVVLTLALNFGEKYLVHIGWGESFQSAVAAAAASLARVIDRDVSREGTVIGGGSRSLVVSLECTALYAKALFCAGVIAFPARWRQRAFGLIIGVAGVAVLNIFRIAGLVLIARHASSLFHFAHLVLMQWFLISCVAPLWLAWAVWAGKKDRVSNA